MQVDVTRDLTPDQAALWDAFLLQAKTSHPEQDPRFAAVHRAEGKEVIFALGFEGGALQAVGLFALTPHPFRKGFYSDAMAYSGPICDDRDKMLAFLNGIRGSEPFSKAGRLRVTPYWLDAAAFDLDKSLGRAGWEVFEAAPMRQTGLIDLSGSLDQLLGRFSQTGRRKLRKAEKLDLTVRFGLDGAGAQDFLGRLNAHHRHRRITTVPEPVFQALLHNVLGPGDLGSVVTVEHDGRFLAGAITYRSPVTAHFMHSVHDDSALARLDNLRISPFLLLQTMKWARDKGCLLYDIEGYRADPSPDDPIAHIYRYKSEFNPREVPRLAGHVEVINPLAHVTGNWRELLRVQARALRARLRRKRAGRSVGDGKALAEGPGP